MSYKSHAVFLVVTALFAGGWYFFQQGSAESVLASASPPSAPCPRGTSSVFTKSMPPLVEGQSEGIGFGGVVTQIGGNSGIESRGGWFMISDTTFLRGPEITFPQNIRIEYAVIFDNDPKPELGEKPWSINGKSLPTTPGGEWHPRLHSLNVVTKNLSLSSGGDSMHLALCASSVGGGSSNNPTPTRKPTSTPVPPSNLSCNSRCNADRECSSNYCYNGRCRNQQCRSESSCSCQAPPTPTPFDNAPPPIPQNRELTCSYVETRSGRNYYEVTYSWDRVRDIGSAGMHNKAYWSQVSQNRNYNSVPGWNDDWDNALSQTSTRTFPESTRMYGHVRSRDNANNQSSWSPDSVLVLNFANCAGTPPLPTATRIPTPTRIPTATARPTRTPTPTITPTSRPSRTPTPTQRHTPTPSNTPSPTPPGYNLYCPI